MTNTRAVIGTPEDVPGQAVMAVRQHLINEGCTIPIDVIREALAKVWPTGGMYYIIIPGAPWGGQTAVLGPAPEGQARGQLAGILPSMLPECPPKLVRVVEDYAEHST